MITNILCIKPKCPFVAKSYEEMLKHIKSHYDLTIYKTKLVKKVKPKFLCNPGMYKKS